MNTEVQLGIVALLSSGITSLTQFGVAKVRAGVESTAQAQAQDVVQEKLDVEKHSSFRKDMEDLVDQLQEERKQLQQERLQDREELAEVRGRVTRLETHERIRDDYIYQLRQHIDAGLPPPPPEWPEELRTRS